MQLPQLRAVGTYKVKAPYELKDNTIYICDSIDGFTTLIERNVDIFETYYKPVNLTEENYRSDLDSGQSIITLISESADTLSLPSSYLLSFPDEKGIRYSHTFITIDTGALPDDINMKPTLDHLKVLVDNDLGVTCKVKVVGTPTTDIITYAQHASNEAGRRGNIEIQDNPYKVIEKLRADIVAKDERLKLLEKALIDRLPS